MNTPTKTVTENAQKLEAAYASVSDLYRGKTDDP